MKKCVLFYFLVSITFSTYAKDDWFCKSESSQIQGSSILACGVGSGVDEDSARAKAFDSAKAEFNRLCSASIDCKGQNYSLEPKRTTCDKDGRAWKCYRLLEYTVFTPQNIAKLSAQLKKGMKKADVIAMLGEPTNAKAGIDMVHVGLTGTNGTYFFYQSMKFCNKWSYHIPDHDLDNGTREGGISDATLNGGVCVIAFDDDNDKVISLYNFRPEYLSK